MSQGNQPGGGSSFCPTCGAQNPVGAARCATCGQPLAKRDELDRLWGRTPGATGPTGGEIIDLYPISDPSLQATTPFTQTRPFDPSDYRTTPPPVPAPPPAARRTEGKAPVAATLGRPASVSSSSPAPPVAPRPSGPHGCVLGCLALLLIGAVAVVVLWGGIKPLISNRVEDDVAVGIANELRTVDRVEVPANGQIVLSEAEINADLDRYADVYEPLSGVEANVTADGVALSFSLYRVTSTFRGGLAVEDGRIVVTDPELSGIASRAIDIDDVAAIFEREVGDLLDRSGLRPTGVRLREGSIVVTTEPTTSTGT